MKFSRHYNFGIFFLNREVKVTRTISVANITTQAYVVYAIKNEGRHKHV